MFKGQNSLNYFLKLCDDDDNDDVPVDGRENEKKKKQNLLSQNSKLRKSMQILLEK